MSKHTPGPWRLDWYGAHKDDAIAGQIDGPNGQHIADIPNDLRAGLGNAALITAAPDLLKALEEIVGYLGDGDPNDTCERHRLNCARAAIAKARGEK